MKSFVETNRVEFKRSWRDEWLKWICAFANSDGGVLYIGIDEKKREVVGVEDPQLLMHQDFVNGQPVQLSVHPDRLYLGNVGGLPKGWKVGSLFRKHTSEARNELIAGALYRGGFVETWGRGIEKVCRECEKFGVPRPEYDATESDVMVCLHAREVASGLVQESSATPQETTQETTQETAQETATENLSPMQVQILALIRSDAAITRRGLAERLGLTSDGVKYHLNALKNKHVLHHEGPTKKGRWVIDEVGKGGAK